MPSGYMLFTVNLELPLTPVVVRIQYESPNGSLPANENVNAPSAACSFHENASSGPTGPSIVITEPTITSPKLSE